MYCPYFIFLSNIGYSIVNTNLDSAIDDMPSIAAFSAIVVYVVTSVLRALVLIDLKSIIAFSFLYSI